MTIKITPATWAGNANAQKVLAYCFKLGLTHSKYGVKPFEAHVICAVNTGDSFGYFGVESIGEVDKLVAYYQAWNPIPFTRSVW